MAKGMAHKEEMGQTNGGKKPAKKAKKTVKKKSNK